jgi:hypothetical protein
MLTLPSPGKHVLQRLAIAGQGASRTSLAASLSEGGGQFDWLPLKEIHGHEFRMILSPITLRFQSTKAMEMALAALSAGKLITIGNAVTPDAFEELVGLPGWEEVEKKLGGSCLWA